MEKMLSYESQRPATPYIWAAPVILWLWAILNGLGAAFGMLGAVLCCLDPRRYNFLIGAIFLALGAASGIWALRVARHAIRVFRREPDAIFQALSATKKSYFVLFAVFAIGVLSLLCALIFFRWSESANEGLVAIIALITVPFVVISVLVAATYLFLRWQLEVERRA